MRRLLWLAALAALAGCATAPEAQRYRLAESGEHWDVVGADRVLEDLRPRYPEFFDLVLDPEKSQEANLRTLRDDLERSPVDRRNFDALNSIAIAYFELNFRAESHRGSGLSYMSESFRSAKLVAVPWRAYGEVEEPALRSAILDFYEDAAFGTKLGSGVTALRLTRVVDSLRKKESDPERLARIDSIVKRLRELEAAWERENPA